MSNKNTQNQRVYMLRPASQRRERVTRVTRLFFFTISQLTSKVKSCNQVEREVTEQTESLSETTLKKKKKNSPSPFLCQPRERSTTGQEKPVQHPFTTDTHITHSPGHIP